MTAAGGTLGGGGGIYNLAVSAGTSSPRLKDTVIYNNRVGNSGRGGGMLNEARDTSTSKPVLSNLTIDMNQASGDGGGVLNTAPAGADCEIQVSGGTISRNVTNYGAGVYVYSYAAARLDGVTIERNNAAQGGGGLLVNTNGHVEFTNSTITGNSSNSHSGGVHTSGPYLTMTNVTISDNYANNSGGGLYNYPTAGTVLTNVRFENNQAANGGAVFITGSEANSANSGNRAVLVVTNGVFTGNTARSNGGAIYGSYNNDSGTTSAFDNVIAHMALTNVLIEHNTAASNGGGVFLSNATPTGISYPGKGINVLVNNVTITDNTATSGAGGGICIYQNANATNSMKVAAYNSIIWGNSASTYPPRADFNNHSTNNGADRIILDRCLTTAQTSPNVTYTATNNTTDISSTSPFTALGGIPWYPGSAALNKGDNVLYNSITADTLLTGSDGVSVIQDTTRFNTFKALIQTEVFDSGAINKDVADNTRIQDTDIDIGAYEKE
jgi:predicted outer membrane repeat protein